MTELFFNLLQWLLVSGGFAYFIVFIFEFIPFHKLIRNGKRK